MVKLNQNAWLKPYIDMDTKFFTENLLATEMRKTQILMNEPIYLGLAILHLSKTVMYEFQYDYVKPKHGENTKLCYMDTGGYIWIHCPNNKLYLKDVAEYVETRFDTSNFELEKSLRKGKN